MTPNCLVSPLRRLILAQSKSLYPSMCIRVHHLKQTFRRNILHCRPTVETRNALYTTASRQAEDVRVQLRKLHQALLKKANISKHSADFSTVRPLFSIPSRFPHLTAIVIQYQALSDRFTSDLDKILAHLKTTTG